MKAGYNQQVYNLVIGFFNNLIQRFKINDLDKKSKCS